MQITPPLWQKMKKNCKALDEMKEESENLCFKAQHTPTKIMPSCPITSCEINGETVETVSGFILGAPKSLQMVMVAMKLKDIYSLEGKLCPT